MIREASGLKAPAYVSEHMSWQDMHSVHFSTATARLSFVIAPPFKAGLRPALRQGPEAPGPPRESAHPVPASGTGCADSQRVWSIFCLKMLAGALHTAYRGMALGLLFKPIWGRPCRRAAGRARADRWPD